jgi:hypothetical protein
VSTVTDENGKPGVRRDSGEGSPTARARVALGHNRSGAWTGNSAEAVHHEERRRGSVDHLCIRVADLGASKRFYELVAPHTGFHLRTETEDRGTFAGLCASFCVVAGTPTEHVHMAFPASDNASVEGFHRLATEAGYRDNGLPGERSIHHEGYYGRLRCSTTMISF